MLAGNAHRGRGLGNQGRGHHVDALALQVELASLRSMALSMRQGVEPALSLVVDVVFPSDQLAALLGAFEASWPDVALRVRSGVLSDVPDAVEHGDADLGFTAMYDLPARMTAHVCTEVPFVAVCAADHALADVSAPIDDRELARHTHLVISDSGTKPSSRYLGYDSRRRWSVGDTDTRLTLLREGLGWCRMPRDRVADDLASGRLVELDVARFRGSRPLVLRVFHHTDRPLGPAGRWMVQNVATSPVSSG